MSLLGPLDRQGTLFTVTQTASASGAVVRTRRSVGSLALTKDKLPNRLTIDAERFTEQGDAIFRSRYIPELRADMELAVEGTTYVIKAREELGRREGWRIFAKSVQ